MSGTVLVTGANGFVGRVVCRELQSAGWRVRRAVRSPERLAAQERSADISVVGDLSGATHWGAAVSGVDAVVHLAARVHQMHDTGPEALQSYLAVNTEATLGLATAARDYQVRRFVYLSTIKVNGETNEGRPFRADDAPDPKDPYGVSKLRAEEGLGRLGREGLEVAIIRPPLVYGPGVRANFQRLMKLSTLGVPLPLGSVTNRRSLVSVWNLASLVQRALEHPAAPGKVWLVSDGDDVSTADLVRNMADAAGRPARLVPVPVSALVLLGRLTGRRDEVLRLTESLQVDISETRSQLGWSPPLSMREGIRRTVDAFRGGQHG
jgi:UDP-4-keto-D-QuiNAc 4-reductase